MSNTQENLTLIAEKIKGMRTAMFVTMNEKGQHVGRPMSTQDIEFDGTVFFITHKDSNKVTHIKNNPEVGLMYGEGVKHVSLSGLAEVSQDKAKIKELWSEFYKAWFEGEDDPNIAVIKVKVSRAEYWDYPGGKVGAYVDMAKSAVTGHQADNGENCVFEF